MISYNYKVTVGIRDFQQTFIISEMAADFYFKTGRPLSLIKQRAMLKEPGGAKPLADLWKGSENLD